MKLFFPLILPLILSALSCARYRDDVERVCGVSAADFDRAIEALPMRTSRGRDLVSSLRAADIDPADRLSREAKREGVVPCALADRLALARAQAAYAHDVLMLCGFAASDLEPRHYQSDRGRAFANRIATLPHDARRSELRAEAAKLGFAGCAAP